MVIQQNEKYLKNYILVLELRKSNNSQLYIQSLIN